MSHRQIHVSKEKQEYEEKINSYFDKYQRIFFVSVDNVQSQQIHDVRRVLRGKAVLVMGKKTLQRKIFKNRAERHDATENDKIFFHKAEELKLLRYNTGLFFTNEEPKDIVAILEKHRVQAPARLGAIAPCDVEIPAGNTGMEPTMTSFFQALNIATKITKGTVEIISAKKVLSAGDRVDNSTATLLQKLKISPFYYQIEVKGMWDSGVIFTPEDLSISDDSIDHSLMEAAKNLSAIALGAGIPTASTVPSMLIDAFKNLLSVSIATKYEFSEYGAAETIKNAREGKLVQVAEVVETKNAPAKTETAAAKKEEKKPEPEPEEDEDFGMGGLF